MVNAGQITYKSCVSPRKEGMLYLTTLSTFYLSICGVRYIVKDHSDSERGNQLPPHGLLFLISSKGSIICLIYLYRLKKLFVEKLINIKMNLLCLGHLAVYSFSCRYCWVWFYCALLCECISDGGSGGVSVWVWVWVWVCVIFWGRVKNWLDIFLGF